MSKKEDREFELEKLKVQIKNQSIWSVTLSVISIEFSIFVPVAITYLSFGLSSGNQWFIILSALILIVLSLLNGLTLRYFGSKKIGFKFEKNIDKELDALRDKFISKCEEHISTEIKSSKVQKITKKNNTGEKKTNNIIDANNWIELHRHFSSRWDKWAEVIWETIKLNTILSSALTSLSVYSVIYFHQLVDKISIETNIIIRLFLLIIPILLLMINRKSKKNYDRQCKKMYELVSIVIKIEEKLGLYENRLKKGYFRDDEWYVPDNWKKLCYSKSEKFVDNLMMSEDAAHQNMLWIFSIFMMVSFALIFFQIILLIPILPNLCK